MKSREKKRPPGVEAFLVAARKIAAKFLWPTVRFDHGDEVALVAKMDDPHFARFIWSLDARRRLLRCLAVGRIAVPARRKGAVFELCARVNEALPFGCAEYSFVDDVVVFRDSADIEWGPFEELVVGTTQRALNLATEYGPAVAETVAGKAPAEALADLRDDEGPV